MKKNSLVRLLALVVLSFVSLSLFAGLNVAKTEHFDIIYADESVEMAKNLYDNAEECYARLVGYFGRDPEIHVPIYITRDQKTYNAYFSPAYYNRIVLFDVLSDVTQGLSNMEDSIVDTFFHELTHAFTDNLTTPFGRFVKRVVGDMATVTTLKENLLLSEGVAVLMESQNGYGRINDPSAMHILKEAKLEGLDLSFYDVGGNRTLRPSGAGSYIFGAGFLSYLQETYGLEKTVAFIVDRANVSVTTTSHSFRKIFGFSLASAWKDFLSSVQVPEETRVAEAVTGWGSYDALAMSRGDLYAVVGSSYAVEKLTGEDSGRILTNISFLDYLSVDEGGRLLVSSVLEERAHVDLYDRSGHKTASFDESNSGAFVGDKIVIVGWQGQRGRISLWSSDGKTELSSLVLGYDETVSCPVALDDSRAAFVVTREGVEHILLLDTGTMELTLLDNPEEIMVRSLSCSEGVLSFSYVPRHEASALPRYGELTESAEGWSLMLSDVDYLGGVWNPVRKGEEVYFVSHYFDHMTVSKASLAELSLREGGILTSSLYEEGRTLEGTEEFLLSSSSYNPFSYWRKGMTIPLLGVVTTSYGSAADTIGFGGMYYTMDPTETHGLAAMVAYDGEQFAYSASYSYKGFLTFSETRAFVDGRSPWERSIHIAPTFTLRHMGETLQVEEMMAWTGGHEDMDPGFHNMAGITYENFRKAGLNRHAVFGYGLQGMLYNLDPQVSLLLKFPRLLPFSSDSNTIFNLPLGLLFSVAYDKENGVGFSETAQIVLWSREIQKYIPYTGLFLTSVDLWAQGNVRHYLNRPDVDINADLIASVSLSPVIGSIGSALSLAVGVAVHHDGYGSFLYPYIGGSI